MKGNPGMMISLANLAALRQRIRIEETAFPEFVGSGGEVPG
jgi:hypothetical protein